MVAAVALGVAAVAAGVAVFVVDSMARATYALAVSFVAVGAMLVLMAAPYLGAITILMMAMEMAVMGVFMVMFMMNPAGLMPMSMVHNRKGAVAVSLAAFLLLGGGALLVPWPGRGTRPPEDTTAALGHAVMGSHMLVMMVVGALLFTTMVAATVLATSRGRYDRDEAEQPEPVIDLRDAEGADRRETAEPAQPPRYGRAHEHGAPR